MKKIICFLIFFFLILECFSQITGNGNYINQDEFVDVHINSTGGGPFGFYSIKLMREGIVYRVVFLDELDEWREQINFIPYTELNKNELNLLIKHINTIDVFKLVPEQMPNNHFTSKRPIRLCFINTNFEYKCFEYNYCDNRIDTLLSLLFDFLPNQDKGKFRPFLRCRF